MSAVRIIGSDFCPQCGGVRPVVLEETESDDPDTGALVACCGECGMPYAFAEFDKGQL